MRVFIGFWKLETKNNFLHVFNFFHNLSFENSFYFLSILDCQTSFLVSKIENCFWKHKIMGKNSYQTYPKHSHGSVYLLKYLTWWFTRNYSITDHFSLIFEVKGFAAKSWRCKIVSCQSFFQNWLTIGEDLIIDTKHCNPTWFQNPKKEKI